MQISYFFWNTDNARSVCGVAGVVFSEGPFKIRAEKPKKSNLVFQVLIPWWSTPCCMAPVPTFCGFFCPRQNSEGFNLLPTQGGEKGKRCAVFNFSLLSFFTYFLFSFLSLVGWLVGWLVGCFVLFCFVLVCFVSFCFVLFCFVS